MVAALNPLKTSKRLLRQDNGALKWVEGSGDVPKWAQGRFAGFRQLVTDPSPGFSCYFAVIAEDAGALRFTYVGEDEVNRPFEFAEALRAFLKKYSFSRRPRGALIAFIEDGRSATHTLACDEERFWTIVQKLHNLDPASWPPDIPTDPEDPGWTFCFDGTPLFIAGHGPSYRNRLSRNAQDGMFLVIQPRTNLEGITGRGPKAEKVRQRIRRLLANYDRIPPSPELGVYGDGTSREWRQYWLPDGNEPVLRTCPLVIRSAG